MSTCVARLREMVTPLMRSYFNVRQRNAFSNSAKNAQTRRPDREMYQVVSSRPWDRRLRKFGCQMCYKDQGQRQSGTQKPIK